MSRRRGLSGEDHDLWQRVARSVAPLHQSRKHPLPEPAPKVKPAPGPNGLPRPPATAFVPQPFVIGQTPAKGGISAGMPLSPAQHLATQALRMDQKTHRRMTQGKLRPEARLDLHGMTLAQAHPELIDFILRARASGLRLVLVITGKGRGDHGPLPTRPGALRHQVPVWLHHAPLSGAVQQVTAAHFRHGGEGAYYVYLRR
ncbi:MAG: Smr/MutS family protein [Paracoccus sp. (in: a-proteobacteria)]|uniref:Smr/MutS family protein n=1 Tax=Paracoccus sp. TaxID=267 RepID=UPI0026DFA8FC|nr:Smr/MutS family protein [Paracoccus sp. (in: a-proteobacteria)]MDO5614241.1 Smr/MutS family protein [Paracoccus sp. (in: a-proteobacteria)]